MRRQKNLFLPLLMSLTLFLIFGVYADDSIADDPIYLRDNAGLLTEDDATALQAHLQSVSDQVQANIVVITVDSLDGKSAQDYADDTYDYDTTSGWRYGEDGALFLIAMDERQWAISTSGSCIQFLHEGALDHMEEVIVPYLSDGNYYQAFITFADLTADYCVFEPNDVPAGYHADPYYSSDEPYEVAGLSPLGFLPVALLVGFLLALLPLSAMKSQLHSVKMQSGTWAYQKGNGLRVTHAKDLFLYRHVTKKPIPRDDPPRSGGGHGGGRIHTSSSGRSHGGRSGGF